MQFVSQYNICCLLQSHTSAHFDLSINFDENVCLHSPGKKFSIQERRFGGVVVVACKQLASDISHIPLHYDNVLAFCLQSREPTIVVCIYVPLYALPYHDNRNSSCDLYLLEDINLKSQESFPEYALIVCGYLKFKNRRLVPTQ